MSALGRAFEIACKTIISLLIALALFFLAKNNLHHTGINYDETASFWISQGLHNYTEVQAPVKGFREILRNNRRANLDPGGQVILLRFWTKFGKNIEWLRLSSFLFFILSVAGLGFLAWEWTRSSLLTVFAMILPFAYDPILFFAFEIRAYSMEVAGIVWGVLALSRVFKKPDVHNFFALGLICALFMGSRYTYFIFVASVCFAGLVFVLQKPETDRKKIMDRSYAFFAPVGVSGLLIYGFALKGQLAHGMERGYMDAWMVHGKSWAQSLDFFKINFLSCRALPMTLALLSFFVIRPLLRYRLIASQPMSDNRPDFTPYYWMILACQILSFSLSAAGFTPWHIGQKWSLYLLALSMIAALLLGSEFLWFLRAHKASAKSLAGRFVGPGILVVGILSAAILSHHGASYKHIFRVDLVGGIEYLEKLDLPDKSVFVTCYEVPKVRYLYEYGSYRGSHQYPRIFRFETIPEWSEKISISAEAEGIRYFLTAQQPKEISGRLLRSKARKIEGVSHHLLKVIPRD